MTDLTLTGLPAKPLAAELTDMGRRIRESGMPDLYEGCLSLPHGGEICRERGRNLRAVFYPKPKLPTGKVESLTIEGATYGATGTTGKPNGVQIPIRIIWPHESFCDKPTSTLVYFHGGGFVVGDLDSHDMHAVRLANESHCVVVNVDYRLAPEHRFPAAYNDCLAATQWALSNIERLGGNAKRLAVGGDSAGGHFAAAVALACRDGGLPLTAQLLLYPATDLSQQKGLPEQAYLGEDIAVLCQDWRASPARASNHTGLAPAILGVGPHDFLYKDNVAYLDILRKANVSVTYREFATLNHGFFSFTAFSKDSLDAAQLLCADLKACFEAVA